MTVAPYVPAARFAAAARRYGMEIVTCAEKIDLSDYGIEHRACIDKEYIERLLGCRLKGRKDPGQRRECGCMESVETGTYHTCRNGCRYCYANHSEKAVGANVGKHNPESPLLIGEVGPEDKITERKISSCKVNQLRFEL